MRTSELEHLDQDQSIRQRFGPQYSHLPNLTLKLAHRRQGGGSGTTSNLTFTVRHNGHTPREKLQSTLPLLFRFQWLTIDC